MVKTTYLKFRTYWYFKFADLNKFLQWNLKLYTRLHSTPEFDEVLGKYVDIK